MKQRQQTETGEGNAPRVPATQRVITAQRRLYPSMTLWELSNALEKAGASEAEKIRLAIRQRDPLSPDYVKPFKTPQLAGNFTLKA